MVTPDKTYALIVGIEKYQLGDALNLNGAASDAYQFYQWLKKYEVPDGNIWLFLSCLDDNLAKYSELNQVCLANRDEIENVINQEIFQRQGELLYVFWGGHGITITDSMERYVLCADADKKDYKCLNISTYLIERLKTKVCRSFEQQIFFFDTCADHLKKENLISCTSYPKKDDFVKNRQQVVLFSCEWGKTSKQLGKERTGLFSQVVREQLQQQQGLIDIQGIDLFWSEVKERFEQLKQEGTSQQNPIIVHYQDPLGSIYQPFRATLYDQEPLFSEEGISLPEQLCSPEETAIKKLKEYLMMIEEEELSLIREDVFNYFSGRWYCWDELSLDLIINTLNCRVKEVNLNLELAILLEQRPLRQEAIRKNLQRWLNEYGTIMSDRPLEEIQESVKQKVQQQGGDQLKTSLMIAIKDDPKLPDQYTLKVWQGDHCHYTPLSVGQKDEERNEQYNQGEISRINKSQLQEKLNFILEKTLTIMMNERKESNPIIIEFIVTEKILKEFRFEEKTIADFIYSLKIRLDDCGIRIRLSLQFPIIFGFYERVIDNKYSSRKADWDTKWKIRTSESAILQKIEEREVDIEDLFSQLVDNNLIGLIYLYGLNEEITKAVLATGTPIMIWLVEESKNTETSLKIKQEDNMIKIWLMKESDKAEPSLIINKSDYGDLPLFIYNHNRKHKNGQLALLWDDPDRNVNSVFAFF